MIKEDYVSYEVAKLLKEKGFDESTSMVYMSYGDLRKLNRYDSIRNSNYNDITKNYFEYTAPSQSMVMKWLREEKRTSIIIEFDVTKRGYCPYVHQLDYDMDWVVKWRINIPMKYEEAIEVALKYTLENLI